MTDSRLEPFLLLARSAKGAAAAKVVENATAANGVYTFNALMDVPNVKESSDLQKHWNLLQLFAYGTLKDYISSPDSYPPLSPQQVAKLKHLTLVSLALEHRTLDLRTTRELENMIIDCIYSNLLTGKMHHHEQIFYVDQVSARDLNEAEVRKVESALKTWSSNAESILKALDQQIAEARESAIQEAEQAAQYQKEQDAAYNQAKEELHKRDRHAMSGLSNRTNEMQAALPKSSMSSLGYGMEGKGGNEEMSHSRAKRTRA
ncbi:hypothetical protein A1Q1_00941 [Trichosporon asahii var. asahii CBS 2479]|uniref:PCI domain-containing protein n=1 Tax=Trichosporon asahii var. asahii (strain ATCC 90039 / CBS 2479 / JCM 2466 / KCTC 7840 / NBRC 103889/ NCYC 2677 / UAMH 7654) TaxID=1186058 RepID=J5QZI9_TRIAS|nr:hypothetical protein A1Q1_00941 [Trichosporon asahii var. asahii CBS 2479]EJT49928.1 hypothetical protein A1Q1_00941 [Trichosporon asahii var. asahii CBS 2479]